MPYTLVIQTEVNDHAVLAAQVPAETYEAVRAAGGVLLDLEQVLVLADHASRFDNPRSPAPTSSLTDRHDAVLVRGYPLAIPHSWLAAMAALMADGNSPGRAYELALLTSPDGEVVWPTA